MNFEFSADQMQLKDIARKFLEKEEAVKRARNVLEEKIPMMRTYGLKSSKWDLLLQQYLKSMVV